MSFFFEKIKLFFIACRGYSLPISIMSWIVPFLYGLFSQGSPFFGILALFGIVVLHLGSNIFDDTIDYAIEKIKVDKGLKKDFNFQKGKCQCIFDGKLTLKQYYIISFLLFSIAAAIGIYFFTIVGIKLLYIIIPTAALCLLYPILGCLGLGEVIIATIFSPMLYLGVYIVMTGNLSYDILLLSISTGLLTVAVLHNHMLADYKFDEKNRKITLCRICRNEKNAHLLLGIIILLAYINLIVCVLLNKLSIYYLIPFLSLPLAIDLYKKMGNSNIDFLEKFMLPEKLLSVFTLLLCISIVADKCI